MELNSSTWDGNQRVGSLMIGGIGRIAYLQMKVKPHIKPSHFARYCELLILLILGIGSPTHPIPVNSWNAFSRPFYSYAGYDYIHFPAPLFVHQYSQAFVDFRGKRDNFSIDYWENSVTATKATKAFFVQEMSQIYSSYSENFWGVTGR